MINLALNARFIERESDMEYIKRAIEDVVLKSEKLCKI